MAFTHALYYPWIDIKNTAWLKTAILYWDKISTIVPSNMEKPYQSAEAAFLMGERILIPEHVNSRDLAVENASQSFLDYFDTPEAASILLPSSRKTLHIPTINQATELSRLNKWKISEELAERLIESGKVLQQDEWLVFDRQSIDYYMTLLAGNLSYEKHFGLLTYDAPYQPLADRVKRGDNPNIFNQELGQALLARMTIDAIDIDPETPLETIIDFRNKNKDEIARFREEMGRLAASIDPETPSFDSLQQQVFDIYTNKIKPAISSLEKALAAKRIRTLVTHLSSIIFAGSIGYFAPDTPANLATYAGCEIIGNSVNFQINRKQELDQNPYSIILSARS